jgi:hypothetical protein
MSLMGEDLGLILLWVALSLVALWALLRFLPVLIKFFGREFREAKDKVVDPETETMTIKVKRESKGDKVK